MGIFPFLHSVSVIPEGQSSFLLLSEVTALATGGWTVKC